MSNTTLKRNEQFKMLVSTTSRRTERELAGLATALADGTRELDMASLEQLTRGILATDDDLLISMLIEYCVSQSIMFDAEKIQVKGWRKLLARIKQGLFSNLVSRYDTIS